MLAVRCTSNVPHIELEAFVHERLNVESLGGHDVGDIFLRELLQDSGLAGIVKAEHEDACLVVGALFEKFK